MLHQYRTKRSKLYIFNNVRFPKTINVTRKKLYNILGVGGTFEVHCRLEAPGKIGSNDLKHSLRQYGTLRHTLGQQCGQFSCRVLIKEKYRSVTKDRNVECNNIHIKDLRSKPQEKQKMQIIYKSHGQQQPIKKDKGSLRMLLSINAIVHI